MRPYFLPGREPERKAGPTAMGDAPPSWGLGEAGMGFTK